MNKQIEEAKEIIQKLLEKNAELKRKLEEKIGRASCRERV